MPIVRTIPVGFGTVTYVFSLVGKTGEITVGTAADFATEPTVAMANELFAGWSLNLLDQQDATITLERVHILYQVDAVDQIVVDSTTAGAVGTLVGDPLSSNCAYLAEKRTALAGRQNIGRMYIPGLVEIDVNQVGALTAARQSALDAALADYLAAFQVTTNVVDMVLLHSCFHDPSDPPCVPRVPTPVVSITTDPIIATQRRRMR